MDLDKLIHSISFFFPLLERENRMEKIHVLAFDYFQGLQHYLETKSSHKVQGIRIALLSCFVLLKSSY
jgi:hypothetical protein